MNLSFLCFRHRRWLVSDPALALSTWLGCYERGLRLEQQARDLLAIRQAGYAMEVAEVLLQNSLASPRDDMVRFSHSALLLVRLLRRQGAHARADDVIHNAIESLRQQFAGSTEPDTVSRACERLAAQAAPLRVPTQLSGTAKASGV